MQDDKSKQVSTLSRKAYEHFKTVYGARLAGIVFQTDYATGQALIRDIHAEKMRQLVEEQGIPSQEQVRKIVHDCGYLRGVHCKNCTVMQTELGFYGSLVPLDFGKETLRFRDFCDLYFSKIARPGRNIMLKGGKDTGKSNMAMALVDYAINQRRKAAVNIPLKDVDVDGVYEVYSMSDLLRVRLDVPFNVPLLFVVDEVEPLWKRIEAMSREHRRFNDFEILTRHLNIPMISIWHYNTDIPEHLQLQVEKEEATLIQKARQPSAGTRGIADCHVKDIPKSPIPYHAEGEESLSAFTMDVDVQKLRRKVAGVNDRGEVEKILKVALDDESILLEGYEQAEQEREQSLSEIMLSVLEQLPQYLTHTGKTVQWQTVAQRHNVGENNAKYIKNTVMRVIKGQEQFEKNMDLKELPEEAIETARSVITEELTG